MTTAAFTRAVFQVDWTEYETAYGSAKDVPQLLVRLAGQDQHEAQEARHDLWCSLCHQHAYVSSAALPALPFVLEALEGAQDQLAVEILDILLGFAICTTASTDSSLWVAQLRHSLLAERPRFAELVGSPNEDIASFAENILENLNS
jgi:hypothetical protein